jgi:hypothetical protein
MFPGKRMKVVEKAERLVSGSMVTVTVSDRHITVNVDTAYIAQVAELDGCYVIKSDLPCQRRQASDPL